MSADQLGDWMDHRGWSDEYLGLVLGVPKTTVWRWRTGARRVPPYLWMALWAIDRGAHEKKPPPVDQEPE